MKYLLNTVALLYFMVATGLIVLGLAGLLFGWDSPYASTFSVLSMVGGMWALAGLFLFSARRARQIEGRVALLQIAIILSPTILLAILLTLSELLRN